MSAFIKTVQNTAFTHKLWKRHSKILIGVSGGPDSMCLLHVLFVLSKKYDFTLHIAHINYGLRKRDSLLDEELVQKAAIFYNIPLSILRPTITSRKNLEEHLRSIRYEFFENIRKEYDLEYIAVAHNQNDQAETVLLHLMRGSGLTGLSGMRYKNKDIIRPFLNIERSSIIQFAKENNIAYRLDKSNSKNIFSRNKIRNKLIPYLEKNFNPAIRKILAHTAITIGDDYEKLLSLEHHLSLPYQEKEDGLYFSATDFLLLDISMQKLALRRLLKQLHGSIRGITSSHILEMIKLITSTKSKKKYHSFHTLRLSMQGEQVMISKDKLT